MDPTYPTCRIQQVLRAQPGRDPATWKALHRKESAYWPNIVRFARRWLNDETAGVGDLLNLELYPWHSKWIAGTMRPPLDVLEEFVWDPVGSCLSVRSSRSAGVARRVPRARTGRDRIVGARCRAGAAVRGHAGLATQPSQ
jgi:hypothetical protein